MDHRVREKVTRDMEKELVSDIFCHGAVYQRAHLATIIVHGLTEEAKSAKLVK